MAQWFAALLLALLVAWAGCVAPDVECEEGETCAPGTSSSTGAGGAGNSVSTPAPTRVTDGPTHDTDKDGILDAWERELASACTIAGRACVELGIQPPTVGVRDYILIQFGRSGPEQDWRLPHDVVADAVAELAREGLAAQVADLGRRDDIDIRALWDDPANEGKFWFSWMTFDKPDDQTAGTAEYNWIEIKDRSSPAQQRLTLLHEISHSILGDLNENWSLCPDEETGGKAHSNDAQSVLYVSADCESQDDEARYRLGHLERTELRSEPLENLRLMNEPGFWAQEPA
jgi:hypothetical protein